MNVTELIKTLEYFKEHGDGQLQVFHQRYEEEIEIQEVNIKETTTPQGIKYLLLNEISEPLKAPLKKISKEEPEKENIFAEIKQPEKKITITKIIKRDKKRGRPKKEKKFKRTGKGKLQREFKGYNVRCRKCKTPKPSTEYKGTWRVCAECRKRKK